MGARENHILHLWVMECGHAVECACRHAIGLKAYCVYCGKAQTVTEHQRVDYHLRRPRNA